MQPGDQLPAQLLCAEGLTFKIVKESFEFGTQEAIIERNIMPHDDPPFGHLYYRLCDLTKAGLICYHPVADACEAGDLVRDTLFGVKQGLVFVRDLIAIVQVHGDLGDPFTGRVQSCGFDINNGKH